MLFLIGFRFLPNVLASQHKFRAPLSIKINNNNAPTKQFLILKLFNVNGKYIYCRALSTQHDQNSYNILFYIGDFFKRRECSFF